MRDESVEGESVEDLLPDYAAGELSDEESLRVEATLAASPRLREELARYERLFVLLSAAAAEEVRVPADLRPRTMFWLSVSAYLEAAARLVEGLLEIYRSALVFYLGLA